MNNSIEAHQLANGEWKVTVKTDLPYYQHLDFKKQVKEIMKEHGFPVFNPVGADY